MTRPPVIDALRDYAGGSRAEINADKALAILSALFQSESRMFPQRMRALKIFRSKAVPGWRYLPAERRVEREPPDE